MTKKEPTIKIQCSDLTIEINLDDTEHCNSVSDSTVGYLVKNEKARLKTRQEQD